MHKQMTLAECNAATRPMAHADGPSSEHKAAADAVKSGRVATNKARILAALNVGEVPAITAGELARQMDIDIYEVRRRLSDLKREGNAIRGKLRFCVVRGIHTVTWSAAS